MSIVVFITLFILAYLLGSVPSSVWIGRIFFGVDVREHGSGNAGTTNTFRVLGVKAGIPVFLIDLLKGWLAVNLIIFSNLTRNADNYVTLKIFLGILAITGHVYPVFANFRGGKGIATAFGVVIALDPLSAMILFIVFSISLIITRIVSLSSIICAIIFPFLLIYVFRTDSIPLIIFSIIIVIAVFITHKNNIMRLISGTEHKVKIFNRKK